MDAAAVLNAVGFPNARRVGNDEKSQFLATTLIHNFFCASPDYVPGIAFRHEPGRTLSPSDSYGRGGSPVLLIPSC